MRRLALQQEIHAQTLASLTEWDIGQIRARMKILTSPTQEESWKERIKTLFKK